MKLLQVVQAVRSSNAVAGIDAVGKIDDLPSGRLLPACRVSVAVGKINGAIRFIREG